jgi:hypothetical protein
MAQIARTQHVTSSSESTGYQAPNRLAAMPGGIASAEVAPIDGVSGDVGVANQEVNYRFGTAFQRDQYGHQGQQERQPARMISRIMTSADTFTAMLRANIGNETRGERAGPTEGSRSFAGHLSKAIGTYETNARVISGQNKFRGTAFSMVL